MRGHLAIPVLSVSDSRGAEDFYCGRLGFQKGSEYRPHDDRADPCYLTVFRDGLWLHLSSFSGDSVAGAAVYLRVQDVDAWFDELTTTGAQITMEPTDQTWGNREMYVRDPDGNSLRFVQEAAR